VVLISHASLAGHEGIGKAFEIVVKIASFALDFVDLDLDLVKLKLQDGLLVC
jgi:hypothetical protein